MRCPNVSDVTMPPSKPLNSAVEVLAISLKSLDAMKRPFGVGNKNSPTLQRCRQADPEKKGGPEYVDHRLSNYRHGIS
jgi:hypothetical protein